MIKMIWRFLWGYDYKWKEYERFVFTNGTEILFICEKSGKMKKVWIGDGGW